MINPQMFQFLQQLKGNPMQFLSQRGFQLPGGTNDPQQLVQQMMNSGRISQQQFEQVRQFAVQNGMFPDGAQRR